MPAVPGGEKTANIIFVNDGKTAADQPKEQFDYMDFHSACQRLDWPSIEYHFKIGTSPNLINLYGKNESTSSISDVSPLHWATTTHDLKLLHQLLIRGGDVNLRAGSLMATPFHWALKNNFVQGAALMLKMGQVDLNVRDAQGYSALHIACNSKDPFMFWLLVSNTNGDLDINSRDSGDRTVLHWSAYNGCEAITRCALLCGANVEAIDASGDTALHWACIKGNLACLRMLLLSPLLSNYKELLGHRDEEQKTPRDWLIHTWGSDVGVHLDEIVRLREIREMGVTWPWYHENGIIYTKVFYFECLTVAVGAIPYLLGILLFAFAPILYIFVGFFGACWMLSIPAVWNFFWKKILRIRKIVLVDDDGMLDQLENYSFEYLITRSGLLVGVLLSVKAVALFTHLKYILPSLKGVEGSSSSWWWWWPMIHFVYFSSSFGMLFFLLKTRFTEPGYLAFVRKNESGLVSLSGPNNLPSHSSYNVTYSKGCVTQLSDLNMFDDRHFCVTCCGEKPFRSKHCKYCNRCVRIFDHHCPWVSSCIGKQNQASFFLLLLFGSIAFLTHVYANIYQILQWDDPKPFPTQSSKLAGPWWHGNLCDILENHSFCVLTSKFSARLFTILFIMSQQVWVYFLLAMQSYNLARNTTSNEMINEQRYSAYMKVPITKSISSDVEEDISDYIADNKAKGKSDVRKVIVGYKNKFDRGGCMANCWEFWVENGGSRSDLFDYNEKRSSSSSTTTTTISGFGSNDTLKKYYDIESGSRGRKKTIFERFFGKQK